MALFGQAPSDAQCHTARQDRDFVERVAVGQHGGQHGVTTFMECHGAFFFGIEREAFATRTHDHAITGIFKIDSFDFGGTTSHGDECCFVNEVGQISTTHSGGGLGHRF